MSTRKPRETIAKQTLRDLDLSTQTDAYGVEYGLLATGDRCTVLISIRATDPEVPATRFTARLPQWSQWAKSVGLEDRVCGVSMSIQTWDNSAASALLGLSFTTLPRPTGERKALRRRALIEEISTHLGRVLDGLRRTCDGFIVKVCTSQDITDFMRAAFDSNIAADVEERRTSGAGTGLTWSAAPPQLEASTDTYYAHDRAASTSWALATREDEDLPPLDFATLLTPTPGILCKRMTLIFRIAPRLEATLAPFGLIATADVGSVQDVPIARELPAQQTLRTRLRLRAAIAAQDTTFLAGLPLDLATPHTVMVPRELKESA